MSKDLSSEEIKDPFVRAMKRFVEPADVWTPRHLWVLRLFAFAGLVYSITTFGGLAQPAGVALFLGSMVVLGLCEQLRRLWSRIERLESDVMLRDLASRNPVQTGEA
jgi:hypothetical protein